MRLRLGPLTPQMAWRDGLGTRLAAQILKLKQEGHNISTEMVYQGGVQYARYHLTEGKRDEEFPR